jgi:chromate transport protein ChrA
MWLWLSFAASWALWTLLGVVLWVVLALIFRRPLAAELMLAVMAGMTPLAILLLFRLTLAVFDKDACACQPSAWPRLTFRTLRKIVRHPLASTRPHLVSSRRRQARRT